MEQRLLDQAVGFAFHAHKNQYRKGKGNGLKIPYIIHPLDVLRQVCEWGVNDPDTCAACLLHDVIEDTNYTELDLEDAFGVYLTDIVNDLTFRDRQDGESSQGYQTAKSNHMGDFVDKSVEALVIKLADRICNCRDFLASDSQYAKKYFYRADGLWKAWDKRQSDIIAKYGKEVREAIERSLSELNAKVCD